MVQVDVHVDVQFDVKAVHTNHYMRANTTAIWQLYEQAPTTVDWSRAALVTASWQQYAGQPMAIKRARGFADCLSQVPISLQCPNIFAGNTTAEPRSFLVFPEYGCEIDPQYRFEGDDADDLANQLQADWSGAAFWRDLPHCSGGAGPGHLVVDYSQVLQRGLDGMCAELEDIQARDQDADRVIYRGAMLIMLRAVADWADRWSEAALQAAAKASGAERERLLLMAQACRQVPRQPARNYVEALQAILFIHFALVYEGQGVSLSLGALDRVLASFEAEVAIDFKRCQLVTEHFLLAIMSNSMGGKMSKTQCITLGGRTVHGDDACNAVTEVFLQAFAACPVADPHCFVRWHPDLAPAVWDLTNQLLAAGRSMPMVVNDAAVIPDLIELGLPPERAADYVIIGCNEVGIPGWNHSLAHGPALYHNDLQFLIDIMHRSQPPTSTEAVMAAWEAAYRTFFQQQLPRWQQARHDKATHRPMPLTSAFFLDGIERGEDYQLRPENMYACAYTRGTTNAINCLSALAVNERQGHAPATTWRALVDPDVTARPEYAVAQAFAMRANHLTGQPGTPSLAKWEPWGNDCPDTDRWGDQLAYARQRVLSQVAAEFRLPGVVVCHVVRSLHHLDGQQLPATPDGRAAGAPLADSLGAMVGTARLGPTAELLSVARLPRQQFRGLANVNVTLPRAQAEPAILQALISGFFQEGGQELQINVLCSRQLRQAQANPAAFPNLVVRIAGLNARFGDLSSLEQDEIIRRAELAERGMAVC